MDGLAEGADIKRQLAEIDELLLVDPTNVELQTMKIEYLELLELVHNMDSGINLLTF